MSVYNFIQRSYSSIFNSTSTKIIKQVLDVPQRPLGAYALFIKDEFKNRPKSQDVQSYFRGCATKWKNISHSQRSMYEERATRERARYMKAWGEFLDGLSLSGRQLYGLLKFDERCKRGFNTLRDLPKSDRDWLSEMPKQPVYKTHGMFMSHFLKGKKPDFKAAQNAWKKVSSKEKEDLSTECKVDVERYANEVKNFVSKTS